MDIKDRLEDMKARYSQNSELSNLDKTFVSTYYERVTGKNFNNRGCSQCYRDAFIEMSIYIKNNGLRDMGKFILKRGVVRTFKGGIYNRISMTDDIAIALLKQYPTLISDFEVYPDNWEQLTKQEVTVEEKSKRKRKTKESESTDQEDEVTEA